MEQESLRKATELTIDTIQNSDINELDKVELMMNLYTFLDNYHEAIKQRFEKPKCDKCKIELREVFIQQGEFRTYKLCKTCNDRYLQYMENIKKITKGRDSDGRSFKENN